MMDPNSGTPIIILKDVGKRYDAADLGGAYEANAIALELKNRAAAADDTRLTAQLDYRARIQVKEWS